MVASMNKDINSALQKAAQVKLVIFDVDGVMTDGKIYFTDQGDEYKGFHSQDGLGIKLLLDAGIEVAIITGRHSKIVQRRMQELGVNHIFQAQDKKLIAYEQLKTQLELHDHEISYTGDDLNDLPVIKRCGLGIAVANATPFVLKNAAWITTASGGNGAVREVCEFILDAQNVFERLCEFYS